MQCSAPAVAEPSEGAQRIYAHDLAAQKYSIQQCVGSAPQQHIEYIQNSC